MWKYAQVGLPDSWVEAGTARSWMLLMLRELGLLSLDYLKDTHS